MKFYFFLLAALLTAGLSAQTTFVNINNTTPGDGTSWATAYANLNDALLAAPAGAEVWIAAGTYVTPDTVSFFINKELTVLGGFAGTETSADAADPDTNPTILSGDVMGNDPAMGFDSTLFADNNRVLFITDTADVSSYTVTLDGLTITHGGLATFVGDFNSDAGGGISSFAKLQASRLKFTNNYAATGAAFFLRFPSTNESVFDDIEVSNNFTEGNRAVYVRDNIGVEIKNSTLTGTGTAAPDNSGIIRGFNTIELTIRDCDFSDIWSASGGGAIAMNLCADALVEGCNFEDLRNNSVGAAIRIDNGTATVRNSTFEQISGTNGAAFFVQHTGDFTGSLTIENCIINECVGGAFGGALSLLSFDDAAFAINIDGCTITDNAGTVDGQGGAIYTQGNDNPVTVTNTLIQGSTSRGGSFVNNSDGSLTIRNTRFLENGNTTTAGRGALVSFVNPGQPVVIDSCLFENNQITNLSGYFSNGASILLIGGDQVLTPLTISNTQFINNAAAGESAAGGIYLQNGFDLMVDNCEFNGNSSGADGGAIVSRVFENLRDTSDMGVITVGFSPFQANITNSRFLNNFAFSQGGAIATSRSAMDVSNCLFVANTVGETGNSGGAIIFNGSTPGNDDDGNLLRTGDLALASTMINNTFVNNRQGEGDNASGNDVALFQQGDDTGLNTPSMSLTLLNNAFLQSDQGTSVEVELVETETPILPIGNVTVTTLGGNFYNNEGDEDLGLIGDNDILDISIDSDAGVEALFVDILDDDGEGVNAQLSIPATPEDNPLINSAVVSDLVPTTDIEGNPRGDAPDIGAYETDQSAVSTAEPLANSGLDITFFPNPTQDVLNVRNDEASIERFTLLVSDQNGRVLKANQFAGTSNQVDFTNVPAGVYNLQVVVAGKIYSQQIVKQ